MHIFMIELINAILKHTIYLTKYHIIESLFDFDTRMSEL